MDRELLEMAIVVAVALPVGYVAGNAAVYAFNKIPARWLTDYGESPGKEVISEGKQRVKSVPWKYVFAASFMILAVYLGLKDWIYAMPALVALWLLLLIAIGDVKYKVIPDQLSILLAVTGLGFVPFQEKYTDVIWGALLGFFVVIILNLGGKLIFKKDTIGMGDAKLCGALGLILGWKGVGMAMIAASFLGGLWGAFGLLIKKHRLGDQQPMGPFLALGAVGVILFYV